MPIQQLLEKQQALWDLRRQAGQPGRTPGRFIKDGISYGPSLVISRECGSGGVAVAQAAGKALGWMVYDREIVNQISEMAHAREKIVASVDEKVRTAWETAWREVLFPQDMDSERYLRCLRDVVMALGHHGEAIFLGRGAHCILPSISTLRVRLVAPFEKRALRVAETDGIPLEQARRRARQLDGERAEFVRKFFRADATSPLNYDLVVNTDEMGIEGAVQLVLSALRAKLGVPTPA